MAKPILSTAKNFLEDYRAAANAKPDSAQARANLGWGYYGKELYDEAVGQFERALALDSQHIEAHYGMALSWKKLGKTDKAMAEFKKAATLAGRIEDKVRAQMLLRLIHGHVNFVTNGDWNISADLWRK